jgi:outer membrane lipoprotein-sorting protein
MRRIIVLILFFVCLQVVNSYADNSSQDIKTVLGDLEKTMSGTKTIQTDFIQEKNLALFNQKIILKGRIFIQKPGLLSWRVMSPMRYSMVMKGSTISQWDEDTKQVQQVSLANNPSFQVVIVQMQNWFCGTFKSMLDDYKITLTTEHPIFLEFVPLENSVSRNFIKRVTVLFQNDERYIKEVHIEEENGDSTSLSFVNTQLNLPIEPSAWEVRTDVR